MKDRETIIEYFSPSLIWKLPLTYQYATVFKKTFKISKNETKQINYFFKSEKYKSDYVFVKSYYKIM